MMKNDFVEINGQQFITKVAVDADEFETGLMFQPWPPPVMSFPFEKAGIHKFYMKNTPSPLDIVFSYDGKIIDIVEGKPYSLENLGPETFVDLVVELPRGTAEEHGFRLGHKIKLYKSIHTLAKSYQHFLTRLS